MSGLPGIGMMRRKSAIADWRGRVLKDEASGSHSSNQGFARPPQDEDQPCRFPFPPPTKVSCPTA
jgi:hypothetical protein